MLTLPQGHVLGDSTPGDSRYLPLYITKCIKYIVIDAFMRMNPTVDMFFEVVSVYYTYLRINRRFIMKKLVFKIAIKGLRTTQ